MAQGRRPRNIAGPVVAGLVMVLALCPAGAIAKKKGGGKTRTFSSGVVNIVVPDDPGVNAEGLVQVPLEVAGKFRGRRIDDVNVSLRVSDPNVGELKAVLTAPNGATTELVNFTSGTSWGTGSPDCDGSFLTLDDETPFELITTTSSAPGFQRLFPPYAGVAQPEDLFVPLAVMDRGRIRGSWLLTLRDGTPGNGVATLHCWEVTVKPARGGGGGK